MAVVRIIFLRRWVDYWMYLGVSPSNKILKAIYRNAYMPAWSTWAKIPFFFSFNFLVFFGTLWCFPWFWAPLWLPLWSPILCNLSVIGNVMKFSFQRYRVSINQTCSSKVISLRKLDTSQTKFFFFFLNIWSLSWCDLACMTPLKPDHFLGEGTILKKWHTLWK